MRTTKQQRRWRFIAAIAIAMFLSVAFGLSRRDSLPFFFFLARHPSAIKPARVVFTLVGMQKQFDDQLLNAQLFRLRAPD